MKILALDPANLTGYAHSDGPSGVWDLTDIAATNLPQHAGTRLWVFEGFLRKTIEVLGCDMLAAEDASFGSNNPHTAAQHNELKGIILRVAAELCPRAEIKFFAPSTIKLFATGNGASKKPAMIAAFKRHFGKLPRDDNEADALWILALAQRRDCWAKPTVKKPRKQRVLKRAKKRGPDMLFAK